MTRIDEIVEQLEGTSTSLEEVLTDEEMDNDEITDAIDSRIFCCEYCNWWYEISEMSEVYEQTCTECEYN